MNTITTTELRDIILRVLKENSPLNTIEVEIDEISNDVYVYERIKGIPLHGVHYLMREPKLTEFCIATTTYKGCFALQFFGYNLVKE